MPSGAVALRWSRGVLVPIVVALITTGVKGWTDARASAKRDDALIVAFSSCVQALDHAREVVEAAQRKAEGVRPGARGGVDKSVLESRPVPMPPPGSAVLRMEAVKPSSSTAILDQIARDHGWSR